MLNSNIHCVTQLVLTIQKYKSLYHACSYSCKIHKYVCRNTSMCGLRDIVYNVQLINRRKMHAIYNMRCKCSPSQLLLHAVQMLTIPTPTVCVTTRTLQLSLPLSYLQLVRLIVRHLHGSVLKKDSDDRTAGGRMCCRFSLHLYLFFFLAFWLLPCSSTSAASSPVALHSSASVPPLMFGRS